MGRLRSGVQTATAPVVPERELMGPPWWILHCVKPEGPEEDMGTWKEIRFSEAQQVEFGIDERGEVKDVERHSKALSALPPATGAECPRKHHGSRVDAPSPPPQRLLSEL